ncbi:Ig-like domain-containing protein [Clostridium akagii]|uniref:Ig-like domain-containing protein n=1 Tax=Clostridium akagii TaxID=91623 RepID=UPI000692164E|nr:Ig-like domain-containing protein [Clostridium akagii]
MNRKKISSMILAFLIISNTIPQSIALGAVVNPTAINSILALNSEQKSFADISKNAVNKNTGYTPSIQSDTVATGADFYIADNQKYLKVNSFNSRAIIPTVSLTADTLTTAKYLDCKITTVDNSQNHIVNVVNSRYENLTTGDYALPSINTSNLKSITIAYNVIDSTGNIIKHAKQTINADVASPTLTIKNVDFKLNPSGSKILTLAIQETGDSYTNLLTNPAVYLNDTEVTDAITSYDSTNGYYKISTTIPSNLPAWNLQVSVSDDSLNIGSTSISNDALINFNNMSKDILYAGTDNNVLGTLPSNGNIKDLTINDGSVAITSNTFKYKNISQGDILAKYNYGQDNIPVMFTTKFNNYTQNPTFTVNGENSISIKNGGNTYLTTNKLNLAVNLSSVISFGFVIDSIKYDYNNATSDVNFTNKDSSNFSVDNFQLPNDDENKSGKLTIEAHDALGNESDFSCNVYTSIANGVKTPNTNLNSPAMPTKDPNGVQYFAGEVTPSVDASNPLLDLAKSNFTLQDYNNFAFTQLGTSSVYYLNDAGNIKNENNIFSFISPIHDGIYKLSTNLYDIGGNTSTTTSSFIVDTGDVTPNISGIKDGDKVNVPVTPIIHISDEFLTGDDVGIGKKISATLNGQNYNLTFVNKVGNALELTGDPITTNSPKGDHYDLEVSASNIINPTVVKKTTVNFILDNEAPKITSSGAENGKYYTGQVNPVLNISDNYSILNHSITINGSPYTGNTSTDANGNIVFSGDTLSADATYKIDATATDEAGNTYAYETIFTIDNTRPTINISGVQNGEYTNNSSVTPTIKISDTNIDSSQTKFNLMRNGQSLPISPLSDGNLYSFNLENEGNYTLSVTSVDKAGNIFTTEPVNFTIDRTPPILNYNSLDGAYINHSFKPSITTEDTNDFISELLINGIAYNPNNIPDFINNMLYQITVQGKDKAGNLSELKTFNFTIDTVAPALSIQNLMNNFYYNRNVGPNITSTDINPESFTMTLNGAPYNNEPVTKEGKYELEITSIDKAGNVSTRSITFVIDKTAASITIGGLINNSILTSIISPLISINDSNADVTILLDGQDYHGGPITTDGKHTLIITTVDEAGNISTKIITFFLKATKPTININNVENGSSYDHSITPVVSFSKDVVADDTVMLLDGKSYNQGDVISLLGDHELDITVNDYAGNKVTKKIKFTITSTSIIAAVVPKALAKALPAKVIGSKKNLSIVLASTLAIIIGGFGIALLKLKSINIKNTKKSDEEK